MMGKSSISMGNGFHGTRGYTKIYRLTTTRALNLGAENIGTRKKKHFPLVPLFGPHDFFSRPKNPILQARNDP